jgi:membrane protease subunit HflC|tara:strand:+ start:105 stop:1139 length:1035 start_codon:yes stop_codon:yes gene_type:complete
MNKKFTPIIVLVIIIIFTTFQALFQINETEVGIVTRFGEFRSSYITPGLKVKVPFIDTVTKFDKRLQRVDVPPESLLTSDKKRIRVDAYARYKILDPLLFFKTLTDETTADSRIASIVASNLREEIALDTQDEVISEKREIIMGYITNSSNFFEISASEASNYDGGISNEQIVILTKDEGGARYTLITEEDKLSLMSNVLADTIQVKYLIPLYSKWGVEIIDVRIKRADFPESVESSIFERMVAERFRKASAFKAEGEQRDKEIRAEVDRLVEITLETARGEAAILRGEGEKLAIDALAQALSKDPEFYGFVRSLEAYEASLPGSTIILDPNSELFQYLEKYSK